MNNLFGRIKPDLSQKVQVNGIEIGFVSIIIESCLIRGTVDQAGI